MREYSEYNALSSLNGHTLPGGPGALTSPDPTKPEFPIGQILVEMHIFEWQGITASVFLDWWESMEFRGLRALHREIDTVAPGMGVEGGAVKLCSVSFIFSFSWTVGRLDGCHGIRIKDENANFWFIYLVYVVEYPGFEE
ncbi:hypothetical protein NHQ30_004341 [Ciborinia camelliae]|nr:hypothetical protein NHQ30_004341 [Ciborinia camelliae]